MVGVLGRLVRGRFSGFDSYELRARAHRDAAATGATLRFPVNGVAEREPQMGNGAGPCLLSN